MVGLCQGPLCPGGMVCKWRGLIAVEQDEEATVILNYRIHQGRERVEINLLAVGFVIALVPWVVYEYGI